MTAIPAIDRRALIVERHRNAKTPGTMLRSSVIGRLPLRWPPHVIPVPVIAAPSTPASEPVMVRCDYESVVPVLCDSGTSRDAAGAARGVCPVWVGRGQVVLR